MLYLDYPDNPITVAGVEEQKCCCDSANTQFQYETEQQLDSQLKMEYGNVSYVHSVQLYALVHLSLFLLQEFMERACARVCSVMVYGELVLVQEFVHVFVA